LIAAMSRRRLLLVAGATAALATVASSGVHAQNDRPFSPFVTSPPLTVQRMLAIAGVAAGDHVIDLGSGDGRIPIAAALKFGATGLGVDLDAMLVELANRNAQQAGVADRVRFERQNVFETDVRKATVVTLYLLPPIVQGLRPGLLRQLRPGSRIVSHDFPFEGWQADASETFFAPEKNDGRGGESTVFLYVVPATAHGRWQLTLDGLARKPAPQELVLIQANQFLDAELVSGRQVLAVSDARLNGPQVRFTVAFPSGGAAAPTGTWRFEGRVDGESMAGQARDGQGGTLQWQARRTAVR